MYQYFCAHGHGRMAAQRTPSMGDKGRELDRGETLRLKMNEKLGKEREIPRCWDRGAKMEHQRERYWSAETEVLKRRCWDGGAETEVLRQRCWDGAAKEFSNQASASQRERQRRKGEATLHRTFSHFTTFGIIFTLVCIMLTCKHCTWTPCRTTAVVLLVPFL